MIINIYSIKYNFHYKNIFYVIIDNKILGKIYIYKNHTPFLISSFDNNIIIFKINNKIYKNIYIKKSLIEIKNNYINIFEI